MAKLFSNNKSKFVELNPRRFEYQDEDWIISHLIFHDGAGSKLDVAGAFLRIDELGIMVEEIKTIIDNVKSRAEIEFMEPYFKISCVGRVTARRAGDTRQIDMRRVTAYA